MLPHLLICAFFITIYWLARRSTPNPQNKYNAKCSHAFFLLRRKISQVPTTASLAEFDDLIDDFYAEYIDKAYPDMVRDLCGELHTVLSNRYFALKYKMPFAVSVN